MNPVPRRPISSNSARTYDHDQLVRLEESQIQFRKELDELKMRVVGYDGNTKDSLTTLVSEHGNQLDENTQNQKRTQTHIDDIDKRQVATDSRMDAGDRARAEANIRQDTTDKIVIANAAKQVATSDRFWSLRNQILAVGGLIIAAIAAAISYWKH